MCDHCRCLALKRRAKQEQASVQVQRACCVLVLSVNGCQDTGRGCCLQVTKNYAMAYARAGVRVNSVNPGYTVTDVFGELQSHC